MKAKPDYARIADLERAIYGEPVSAWPPAIHERIAELRADDFDCGADSLDAFVREVLSFMLPWRPLPPELAGSRLAWAGKVAACSLLGFAAVWVVLMGTGLVPWSG